MPSEDTLSEIRSMISEADRVAIRVREVERGARFQRSDDRAESLTERVRRARSLLELVINSLDGSNDKENDGDTASEGTWLRGKIKTLSSFLAGGATAEPRDGAWKARQPATSERKASPALKGRLGTTTITDLMSFLQVSARTGTLTLVHPDENVCMEFIDGRLVRATSDNMPPESRLGEILVAQGALDEARLKSILFCTASTKTLMGEALRRGDVVTEEQLRSALEEQFVVMFKRVLDRKDARFTFDECAIESMDGEGAYWTVTELLTSAGGDVDHLPNKPVTDD
ncbi:MAG: DUF4388 domain-containing protein [bacterium]|nr:DUF4388 domain-containing protein [bacterium]